MGKALIFIVAATALGGSLLLYQTQMLGTAADAEVNEHSAQVIAREAARSGLAVGLSDAQLSYTALSDRSGVTSRSDGRAYYDLEVEMTPQATVLVTSTGRFQGYGGGADQREFWDKAHRIQAELARVSPTGAAVYVNSPDGTALYNGTAFEVSGVDSRPGSLVEGPFSALNLSERAPAGVGASAPAIAASDAALAAAFTPGSAGQQARVVGIGGEGNVVENALPGYLTSFWNDAVALADAVHADGWTVTTAETVGSPQQPEVHVVYGDAAFDVTAEEGFIGHGVLLVEGDLAMEGNFEWNGIVFARKTGEMTVTQEDHARIYGSLVLDNPSLFAENPDDFDFEIDPHGGVTANQPFHASIQVLGASISGHNVTVRAHVGDDNFDPWGDFNDPVGSDVNGTSGELSTFSIVGPYQPTEEVNVTGRSWKHNSNGWYVSRTWTSGNSAHTDYVKVLRDGDLLPNVYDNGQPHIEDFIANYVDGQYVDLAENQVIYLYELGRLDISYGDYQDLVALITIWPDGADVGDGTITQADHYWYEAEGHMASDWGEMFPDADASGETYVVHTGGDAYNSAPDVESMEFGFSGSGPFAIWTRVYAPSGGDDSFWMRAPGVDGGAWDKWNGISASGGFEWVKWAATGELDDGSHTLEIRHRESGAMLDKVLVTADLDYVPEGLGGSSDEGACLAADQVWYEAEDQATWGEVQSDADASGNSYVVRPNGSGNSNSSPPSGVTPMEFAFSGSGPVAIWARVDAPSGSDNSFWMSLDDGDYQKWNGFSTSGFEWVQWTSESSLSDGDHTLRILYREDGAGLDKVLISRDLSYSPSGFGESADCGASGITEGDGDGTLLTQQSSLTYTIGDDAFVRYSEEAIGRLAGLFAALYGNASVELLSQRSSDPTMPSETILSQMTQE